MVAFNNILMAIDSNALLPNQVFKGLWNCFLFCESDNLVSPRFVETIAELIRLEGATTCCLLNYSETRDFEFQRAATLFIEIGTTSTDYISLLEKGGPATGWLYAMGQYGCSSDKGEWCIYSERANDVAVIALRHANSIAKFASPLESLYAKPIEVLIDLAPSVPVPFNDLTDKWKRGLVEHYN